MKKQIILLAIVLMNGYSIIHAQCVLEDSLYQYGSETAKATAEAKNGQYLTTSGTIRVLVVYIEVNYDITPGNDPYPTGTTTWAKNQLPTYKDNLFDLNWTGNPQGMMTKYFAECSLNNYKVLGDYIDTIITVNESDLPSVSDSYIKINAFNQLNLQGYLNTYGVSTVQDLDNWANKTSAGDVNVTGPDSPYSYDHVMFIFRNYHGWGDISGTASQGSAGTLLGYQSDTHSTFNGGGAIPFNIIRHEYSHLLFGSNNFHTGGSHSAYGTTFIPDQKGWSMLGGSESSFQTCNAWDRDRMDWKGFGKTMNISAMDINGVEINGNLDATNSSHAGIYVLRDFVTTGDAVKIKLPFIPSGEYQEYIWLENHQTGVNNGSDFDHFIYEADPCMDDAAPGLFMYLQAGKGIKTGTATYDQQGHYLRFIPADGMYDLQFESTQMQNFCISWGNWFYPFEKQSIFSNPLSGSEDLEQVAKDLNSDDKIFRAEGVQLIIEKIGLQYHPNLPYLGHSRHAFTLSGVNKIGIGTNPSANSMLTLERGNNYSPLNNGAPDNIAIRLNGVSVNILEELPDGSIKVKVDFDKTDVENDVRWAGNIELPAISGSNGYSLNLKTTKTINIDRGYTATKIDNPMTISSVKYFVDNTKFTALSGSYFHLEANATVNVINGSKLLLKTGSKMELEAGATLHIAANDTLEIENGAELNLKPGAKLIIDAGATVKYKNNTANKGLLVGATTNTGNPAKVEVYGNITFTSGAIWTHNRDGFYRFYPTNSLTIPATVPVKFTGKGKTIKFVELANNTTLTLSSINDMDWNSGLVYYGSNTKIVLNDVDFTSVNATYNPTTNSQITSTGVELINPRVTLFNSCDFNKLNKGVVVNNVSNPTNANLIHIQTGKFTAITTHGVELNNVANFRMTNGFIDGGAKCLFAQNSNLVDIYGTEFKNSTTNGIQLSNVSGAYFSGANIHNNPIGIFASASLVFLRNGAKIHTNSNGVEIYGSYNSGISSYTAMLTMGDIGCGSVYNNSNFGIYGVDALLNIDAVQHSINRGDNIIKPNRFDNNTYKTFEICYGSSTVAPSQINAKGNFWGVSPADIQPSQYTFTANQCVSSGGTLVNIPLIHTDYSTCVPTTTCMDCSIGGGGGSSSAMSSTTLAVQTSFKDANTLFVAEDNTTTRNEFSDVSAVGLIKDTLTDTWKGQSINNEQFNLTKETVHLVQVSKAIKATTTNSTGRMMNIVNNIFKEVKSETGKVTSTVTLYPNPTNDKLFVDVEKEGNYLLVVYTISGQAVIKQTLTEKHNLVNVNKLPNGLYLYELSAPNSNTVKGNITIAK